MVLKETVGPWEHVSYDLISGFKTSKSGNTLCLVVMCEFTKGVEVIPLKDAEAETVARALVNEVFYRHGIPRRLHSDRGSNMNLSNVMKNACELLGISRSLTTAGHPEGNGLVERFNRFLVQGLYCLMNRKEDDWDVQIPALLYNRFFETRSMQTVTQTTLTVPGRRSTMLESEE
jgi:transposase InsO family protein